jgi:hypothetical protein
MAFASVRQELHEIGGSNVQRGLFEAIYHDCVAHEPAAILDFRSAAA